MIKVRCAMRAQRVSFAWQHASQTSGRFACARIISCGSDPAARLRRPRSAWPARSWFPRLARPRPAPGRARVTAPPADLPPAAFGRGIGGLELQAELHRRVEEALDGAERNHQPLGNAAERQADFETILGHRQVPELVLEDDGHLFRILRQQPRRQLDAVGGRQKGDEEMMLARAGRVRRRRSARGATPRATRRAPARRIGYDRSPWIVLSRSDAAGGSAACSWPNSRHSPMVLRRRPVVSRHRRCWSEIPAKSRAVGRNEVEASVARCLRTPPNGA